MNPVSFRLISFQKVSRRQYWLFRIFILSLLFNFSNRCFSQTTFEVGIMGGDSYYLGDLNPGKHFQNLQLAYGMLIRYNFDSRWTVKLSGTRGSVKGNSASSTFLPGNQLKFESPITDISGTVEFNFFDYFTGSEREYFTPYIYAGLGVFWFNPSADGHLLQPAGTEGQNVKFEGRKPYKTTSINIPIGLGVKYSLGRRVCIAAFWEIHKTFTDYIDDVSTTYYLSGPTISPGDQTALLSDPTRTHEPGMQRGNSSNKDWYSFSGITLTYKFVVHAKRKCRDIHHK
jgi:hypothetical protein